MTYQINLNKYLPKEVYIGCSLSILLVVVVGFLSLYITAKQTDQERRIEATYHVLSKVDYIQSLLIDMEASRRGFRGTNDKQFLQPYYSSLTQINSELKNLKELLNDNPSHLNQINKLEIKINNLLNFWNSLGADASKYNRETIQSITEREKIKTDLIRQDITYIAKQQEKLLAELKKSNRGLRQKTSIAIITGTVLILGIVSALIYIVIREFRNKVQAFQTEHEINEQKSAFVSLASHEFRTPLSSIQLSASLIQKYTQQSNTDQVFKHTNKIKHSVDHLTTILNEFLSLDRLERGKIQPIFENFDLVDISMEVKEEMKTMAKANQKIVYEHTGSTTIVQLDKKLIKNCLINLVSNAIKYSGDNTTICFHTTITADSCIINIKDNGIGIPEAEQKHLFEPFFRAGNTESIPGTGLGLNIVLRYVKLMNGFLNFESKLNQGSSFTLRFPLSKNQSVQYKGADSLDFASSNS